MIRKLQLLFFFAGGFIVGAFLFGLDRSSPTPVETTYCFFARNPGLFNGRQVLTSAQIWILMHGMVLAESGCPDGALSFTATRDIDGKVGELDAKLSALNPVSKLPVTFIGTLHSATRIERGYRWFRYRMGMSIKPDPIVMINRVVSVGDAID